MKQFKHRTFSTFPLLIVAAVFTTTASSSSAATIFESGTLGPTGIPWSDLTSGAVPSTTVKDTVFPGVRFQLTQPVITTQIGGHFVALSDGTFFGAIVELVDENDFPDSGDLSTPDVLGATSLTFPTLSDEVSGNLDLLLDPGWYALMFGTGIFGTSGDGAAVRNGNDIGDPAYISFQPGIGWYNLEGLQISFDDHRFTITGIVIPETSTIYLTLIALLLTLMHRTRLRE